MKFGCVPSVIAGETAFAIGRRESDEDYDQEGRGHPDNLPDRELIIHTARGLPGHRMAPCRHLSDWSRMAMPPSGEHMSWPVNAR